MKINDKEVELEELIKDINPRNCLHNLYNNKIYLSDKEKEILDRYQFNIEKYTNINDLIFDIDEYLNDNYSLDLDDLESVSESLQEFNYYHNTNK